MQSSCRLSKLICQESFGSNYCCPPQLLLPCVSESSPHSKSHSITLFTNGHAVNEGLAPHHIPVIASVVFIQTLSEGTHCKLFNCGHMQQKRGSVTLSVMHSRTAYWALAGVKPLAFDVWRLCYSISTATPRPLMLGPAGPVLSFRSLVPGHIRARLVLLLCGGRILSAQPELWNHPQTGMSRPSDRRQLYEKICQGDFHRLMQLHTSDIFASVTLCL